MPNIEEKARLLAAKIAAEVTRGAGMGLNAARIFLTARVREAASVPAIPRYSRIDKVTGEREWWTPTKAMPKVPLRRLSGRFRTSIQSYMETSTRAVIGSNARGKKTVKYPDGFPYVLHHEIVDHAHPSSGQHQTFKPTYGRYRNDIVTIVGQNVTLR